MNIDEFFEWLEEYCRKRHYGVSAQTVVREADDKGIDLGHISHVGKKHLLPRGWTRHVAKSGGSLYLSPKKKDEQVMEKGLTTLLIELRRMVLDPDVSKDQLLPIIDKMKDAYTRITDDFLTLISEIKPGQYSEIQKVLEKYKEEIAESWSKG